MGLGLWIFHAVVWAFMLLPIAGLIASRYVRQGPIARVELPQARIIGRVKKAVV